MHIKWSSRLRSIWWLVLLALLLGLGVVTSSANVVISRFDASTQADGAILVAWETATEFNTVGFRLYRSLAVDGPWDDAVNTQPAKGNGTTGATYEYRDTDVVSLVRYYYRLEELTPAGAGDTAGPVTAIGGPVRTLHLPLITR